jgi:glycosyltransferase involved in cell wall biosynthesis
MRRTLDSVGAQTEPPALWVVVDDGSTDDTPKILAEYAQRLPFLRVMRRADRGRRSVGPGVIEAFYEGLESADLDGFDYLCKLDMDLDLPPTYFATLMDRMEAEPRLGTCSGKAYYVDKLTGALVREEIGDEVSIGASKFYRLECFRQTGGFVRAVMWDGIDCHLCRMKGWIPCSWDDPAIRFLHLRPMGSSDRGILRGRVRHGAGQYFMGTGWTYILASAAHRLAKPPWIVGSAAILWGYFSAWVTRKPRYGDREFRRFLRWYQWNCLVRGKAKATEIANARQAAAWSPAGSRAT